MILNVTVSDLQSLNKLCIIVTTAVLFLMGIIQKLKSKILNYGIYKLVRIIRKFFDLIFVKMERRPRLKVAKERLEHESDELKDHGNLQSILLLPRIVVETAKKVDETYEIRRRTLNAFKAVCNKIKKGLNSLRNRNE